MNFPSLVDIIQGIVVQAVGQYGLDGAQAIITAAVHNTIGYVPFLGPLVENILKGVIG